MRLQKHDDHCKSIAGRLDAIVNGEVFRDADGEEWWTEYEPAYGYDMFVTNTYTRNDAGELVRTRVTITTKDGETYKRGDTGETIEDIDEYLEPVSLWDYFEDSIYNIEYRVPNRYDDPVSVCVMVACGGPNIYLDTASGKVELYWWNESGEYPMRRETVDAIDEYMTELYNC